LWWALLSALLAEPTCSLSGRSLLSDDSCLLPGAVVSFAQAPAQAEEANPDAETVAEAEADTEKDADEEPEFVATLFDRAHLEARDATSAEPTQCFALV